MHARTLSLSLSLSPTTQGRQRTVIAKASAWFCPARLTTPRRRVCASHQGAGKEGGRGACSLRGERRRSDEKLRSWKDPTMMMAITRRRDNHRRRRGVVTHGRSWHCGAGGE